MKPFKCLTYTLCLVAMVVTVSPAQTNLGSDQIRQHRVELQRVLGAFAAWTKRYTSKTGAGPTKQATEEGLLLAKERRAALKKLMESDPTTALSAAIGHNLRATLPPQIQGELETQVSGTGDLLLVCAMPAQGTRGAGGVQRFVRLNGETYRTVVYGRRATQTTKFNIPLHGITLDDVFVLDENVLAEVSPEESSDPAEPIVNLSASVGPVANPGAAVLARMGGTLYRFGSAEHLRQSEALLEEFESGPAANLEEPASVSLQRSQSDDRSLRVAPRPQIQRASGVVDYKVLVIRTDFSDLIGDPHALGGGPPYTASSVQELADGQVALFYQQRSYGKTTLHFTVTPQLYRLPSTAVHYSSQYPPSDLYHDAVATASADYAVTNYDKVVVLFSYLGGPNSRMSNIGGLSVIGSPWVWVNGEFDFRVVAHELGHTFGLQHANFWKTKDGDPVSSSGESIMYGDPFDVMGDNYRYGGRADFNPWYKYQLGWIQDDQVQTVNQNGTYRVYRFDDGEATGTLALRVARDAQHAVGDYWIGYRRNFPEIDRLANGAYVIWGWPSVGVESDLLGLGPQVNNARDSGLSVGSILADHAANLTIAPVAEGGVPPNEYLDVQITFGPPPIILRQPNSQMALVGESAQFTIKAPIDSGFEWQRQASGTHDWVTLSDGDGYFGTSTPTLQITASMMMNGDAFRCLLTNAEGGFNGSRAAVLTVSEFGVQTVIGQPGVRGSANGSGVLAQLSNPMGIAVDRAGNAYIADTGNHIIRKMSATGLVSTLAGLAGVAGSSDGVGEEARFNMPIGITVDSAGMVYVVDQFDSTVRRITPDGAVTTLEGGLAPEAANPSGTAPSPGLNHPSGIAADCFGNLYIADTGNNTIRKMAPDGSISTLAGANGVAGAADGQGAAARLNGPFGIAVDLDGNVYVADQGNSTIRKITADGMVTTIAGAAGEPGSTNGIGVVARFSFPAAVAVDDAGNLYVADRSNSTIRKIDSSGNVSTLGGVAGTDGSVDGQSSDARFSFPTGLAVDPSGVVYVADTYANTVRMIRSAAPQPPMLRMKVVAGQVMVCWPASATGFILESRSDFSAVTSWAPASITPVVEGCNFVVITTLQTPAAFFRLQHQ